MKKVISKIVVLTITFTLLITNLNYANAAQENKMITLKKQSDVPSVGTWTLDVSKEVDKSNIAGAVVMMGKEYVPVNVKVSNKTIEIKPITPYSANSNYTLRIFLENGKIYNKAFTVASASVVELDGWFKDSIRGTVYRIVENPKKGFNYPYLLYIPDKIKEGKNVRLFVEPNNTGRPSDDMSVHEKEAKNLMCGSSVYNIADRMNSPILIPVFPRPETNYVYTHELTRDAMLVKNSLWERLDSQLVSMIKDARQYIEKQTKVKLPEKVFMTGFSASSKFTNRFAIMHPEYVRAVATGGINAIPTFPTDKIEGKTVRYPVGISDLKTITGIDFNMKEYKKVSQYIYMGENDTNDDTLFNDAYSNEDRELVHSLIGREMIPDRFNKAESIYKQLGVSAQFVTYKNIGHEINEEILLDMLKFFKENNEKEGFVQLKK